MIESEEATRDWVRAHLSCDDEKFARLERLVDFLKDENTRQNLVSAGSLKQVWQRHIADSAQLLTHVPRETSPSWLDLGTGAGFPGLVIAALRPDIRITMVESRTRRIDWLERAADALELRNATVVGRRLEQVDTGVFGVISARAFAKLDSLLELSARFSTSATLWLLPKGRSAAQELSDLAGWQHTFHVEPSVTDPDAGVVIGTLNGRKGSKT